MNKPFNIIIAGGKTGGHLFPGIAVASALERMSKNVDVLFVGTDAPFETQTLKKYNYAHKRIFSKPIKGGSLFSKVFSISIILVSLLQSVLILKNFKPDFVLGVGGFSSFAVVLAAWGLRIPTGIQEQNAFPGLTNRMLSRFAGIIFTSFEETRGFENNSKVKYVGNPVRKTAGTDSEGTGSIENFDPGKLTILVTGGSQGAHSINTAFIEAISLMGDRHQFNIVHQTGVDDEAFVQKKYAELNITATAKAFFYDMPQLQKTADLAITRAGAGTLSEICTNGLPSILVPFPYAADDHQTFNAQALQKKGAAVMIKDKALTGQLLKQVLQDITSDKKKRKQMAANAKKLALPDADKKIATCILNVKDNKA